MTYSDLYEQFIDDITHMREYSNKIRDLEDILGADLWEGFIGNLFDELFEIKIMPYAALVKDEDLKDSAIETLYELVFGPSSPCDEDYLSYAETYLQEYLN